MRSYDIAEVVLLEELIHSTASVPDLVLEVEDVPLRVRLVLHLLIVGGVAPEQFQGDLLLVGFRVVAYLQGSLDQFDFLDGPYVLADSAVHAKQFVGHHCGEGHVLEDLVQSEGRRSHFLLLEDGVRVHDVFSELEVALIGEPVDLVDFLVLVVASEEVDCIRVFDFEGEEEEDDFEGP